MKGIRKQDFFILICIPVCLHSLNIINITYKVDTVKPTHIVTSIKQSPVLKGHLCLVLS